MCGLTGVFGNPSKDPVQSINVFHQLLIVNQFRGDHSTGVAKLRLSKSKPLIQKTVGDPTCLFTEPAYQQMLKDTPKDLLGLIGHGRYKTKGEISIENAHPFKHGHITLTHNGTVYDTGVSEKFDTDSETICYSLAKKGIEETWKSIRGAAALVWWNSAEHSLNMITNGERPLSYTKTNDERLFWASETDMLRFVLSRNKIELQKTGEGTTGIWSLKPNWLFTWKWHQDNLQKLTPRELEAAKPYEVVSYYCPDNWTKRASNVVKGMFGKAKEKLPFETQDVKQIQEVANTWGLKRPIQVMNYNEFLEGNYECASCHEGLHQTDWHMGLGASKDELICKHCVDLHLHIGWQFYYDQKKEVRYG